MELKHIKKEIIYIIEKITDNIVLNEDSVLIESGINSMQIIQIVVELEHRFNFEFEDEKLSYETLRTIGSIAEYVYQQTSGEDQ